MIGSRRQTVLVVVFSHGRKILYNEKLSPSQKSDSTPTTIITTKDLSKQASKQTNKHQDGIYGSINDY